MPRKKKVETAIPNTMEINTKNKKIQKLMLDNATLKRELAAMKDKVNNLLTIGESNNNRFAALDIMELETNTPTEHNEPSINIEASPNISADNNDDTDFIQVLRKKNNENNTQKKTNVAEHFQATNKLNDKSSQKKNNNNIEINVNNTEKNKTIPPIIITSNDLSTIKKLIKSQLKINNFLFKSTSDTRHALYTQTIGDYKLILSSLKEAQVECFTYTHKDEKPINLILKGLHIDYNEEEINTLLKDLKIENIHINKILRLTTKKSIRENLKLPIYIIQLRHDSTSDNLTKIKYLDNQIIRWEKLKKSPITQCTRCQRFNHSAYNCNMPPRCVKCGQNHTASECNISKNSPSEKLFCTLCKTPGHPASYRQCPVFIQQRDKHQVNKQNKLNKNITKINNISNLIKPDVSYAQCLNNNNKNSIVNSYQHKSKITNFSHEIGSNIDLQTLIPTLIELNKNVNKLCQGFQTLDKELKKQSERIDFLFENFDD